MLDPFSEIRKKECEGNFNGVILTVVESYDILGLVRPELLERIAHYLGRFRACISPQAVKAIQSLPTPDLQYAGLTDILESASSPGPRQKVGRMTFPAVSSAGLVREICVMEKMGKTFSPERLQALDRAGSAVFRVLGERLGRSCSWRPERYPFSVLDLYGKDDPAVEGDSMSLPLALALYSSVTGIPVPPDVSASAALGRDGSVGPVANFREKLAALNRERFFINRVLVSEHQETPGNMSGCSAIRVQSLDQAISVIFPGPPDAACFSGDLDIDAEIRSLNDQYDRYLIDTCIENADELIRYLESKPLNVPKEKVIPALFTCYWKKGSCHCHKGEVRETNLSLKKAISLYHKHPGLIRAEHYFDARVSYAVLLKDIFRYGDAETIHMQLVEEMEQSRILDHIKGKNLSTLSQLFLAMHRFGEAEQYQRRAMKLINREELCRNYGYLAQIHTRSGVLRKAASALKQSRRLLEKADERTRGAHAPFYHWINAEYLYTRGIAMKRGRGPVFRELFAIAEKDPQHGWWAPALVRKFSGLALLAEGAEERGLGELQRVITYFSSQFAHVLRVLGASVRAERALYFFRSGRHAEASEDVRGVIADLTLQKDIKRFFRSELSALGCFLRSGKHRQRSIENTFSILENIKNKIPY